MRYFWREVSMTGLEHQRQGDSRAFYFAKMLVALELRRTHGIVFAAGFLELFAPEICQAAVKLALRSTHDNSGSTSE